MSTVSILSATASSTAAKQASAPQQEVVKPMRTKSLANGRSIALDGAHGAGLHA